eukprot:scaffold712130_cov94-Attheya_sp.AAC.1
MLNKWVKMREGDNEDGGDGNKRPFLASRCDHLHDAERWRRQILREITEGIRKIQNPGMGEHAIRDCNDGINKLIREKWHWNRRIKELGGPDHNYIERKQQAEENDLQNGLGLQGSGGYRYFGAAKDLPGVKELFARHAAKTTKRKRGDVYKYITPDYYGLRDEEDGVLLELEQKVTMKRQVDLEQARTKLRNDPNYAPNWDDESSSDDEDDDDDDILNYNVLNFANAISTQALSEPNATPAEADAE